MRDGAMASPSNLCRFERKSTPWEALKLHGVLFEQFVAAHPKPPKRIVLDFDATDIALLPMQTCTGCRRGATGTATTVRTATCRFTSSAAATWPRERRVVVKVEHPDLGANTRFVVTSLEMADDPKGLHDGMYCQRGEMENRIKDQQLGLFADRASSSEFNANQHRLLLSGLAYALLEGMRRMALSATDLARASPQTIRLTLLKVGAVVMSNTRRVRLREA